MKELTLNIKKQLRIQKLQTWFVVSLVDKNSNRVHAHVLAFTAKGAIRKVMKQYKGCLLADVKADFEG